MWHADGIGGDRRWGKEKVPGHLVRRFLYCFCSRNGWCDRARDRIEFSPAAQQAIRPEAPHYAPPPPPTPPPTPSSFSRVALLGVEARLAWVCFHLPAPAAG